MRIALLLLPLLLSAGRLSATEAPAHPIEAELARCLGTAEGSTTFGSLACIDAAHTAWDRELNRVYGELRKRLDVPGRDRLREAQRRWIAWRDAEIEAIGTIYGALDGTMYRVMQADAVLTLIRERARELDNRLETVKLARE